MTTGSFFDPTTDERTWQDIKDSSGVESTEMIKYLANENFEFFFEHVLGYETSSPVSKEAIKFHQNPDNFKETDDKTEAIKAAVMAPRGHSKTVSWTMAPALWRAYKETGKSIIISSASRKQSTDILEDIKRIITRNEALQHLKPSPENMAELGSNADINTDESTWAAQSITTTSDVTIQTKTFGSSIRGKHVDYVFLDDILQDESGGSRSTKQEKDTFYNVVSPTVENKGGLLQIVGTPMSHDDLLMELIEKDSFHTSHYKAFNPETEQPLWPEKLSKEGLMQKKAEIGPARFAREYQVDPMSVEEQYFPVADCIDPNLTSAHFKPKVSEEMYKDWKFVLGVDVALSDSSGSDYNVFTVLGKPKGGDEVFVVDLVRQQTMSPEAIAGQIKNLDNTYGLEKGFYERNAQGEGLRHEMENNPKIRNRIQPFDTTRSSRPQILSSLQAALYRQELKIVDKHGLKDELSAFRKNSRGKLEGKGHDDTVMSLAIAYECLEGGDGGTASVTIIGDDTDNQDSSDSSGVVDGIVGGENNDDNDGAGRDLSVGIA